MTKPAETIHVVPSFHYDVAYLQRDTDYRRRGYAILDAALAILAADPDYRFTVEQVYLLERYWRDRPARRRALRRFAADGRLEVVPGAYVLPDMNLPSGESLFQQIRLGRAWLRETLGLEAAVYYNPDDWGHPPQLPQMLAQCGYGAYVFWRCMRPEVARADFVWEGLDGTRLPAHWLACGYGNLSFPDAADKLNTLDQTFVESETRAVTALLEQLRPHGGGPDWLMMNGGDFRMPQASAPAALRRLNAVGGLPRLAFSSLTTFLATRAAVERPVVTGEFNSAFQGTFTSNIRLKQFDRRLTHRLLAVERLAVALGVTLPVDALWKPLLKQQFHDIACGTLGDGALGDALREYRAAARALAAAAAAVPRRAAPPRARRRRAFFNPLPAARTERVQVGGAPARIDLPPLGFALAAAARRLPPAAAADLPATFATPHYTAEIGADGYLRSLRAAADGREWVRPQPCPFAAVTMQIDYGDLWLNFGGPIDGGSVASSFVLNDPDPYRRAPAHPVAFSGTIVPRVTTARAVRRGDDELVVEQESVLSYWRLRVPIRTTLTLSRHTPRIEYRTRILPAGRHFRLRAVFPTTLAGGTIRHEVAFGIAVRGEAEHAAQTWIDYGDAAGGLALLNVGTPGNGVHDGALMLTLFRAAAMEYKAPSARSFGEGVAHTFDYAVLPHGPGADAAILAAAHALNQPPLAVNVPADRWGETWTLGADTVALAALRPDGRRVFVRLYEAVGRATATALRPPPRFRRWAPADGLQRAAAPFAPIAAAAGIPLAFRPFEIKALLLRT